MIVVDASVVIAAATDVGTDGEWSREVIRRGGLAAPHLLDVEVLSTIRRLESSGQLRSEAATLAAADALSLPVVTYPLLTTRVWELRHTVTVQDACYVAVAEAIGAPLATLDQKLTAAPGPRCDFLTPGS